MRYLNQVLLFAMILIMTGLGIASPVVLSHGHPPTKNPASTTSTSTLKPRPLGTDRLSKREKVITPWDIAKFPQCRAAQRPLTTTLQELIQPTLPGTNYSTDQVFNKRAAETELVNNKTFALPRDQPAGIRRNGFVTTAKGQVRSCYLASKSSEIREVGDRKEGPIKARRTWDLDPEYKDLSCRCGESKNIHKPFSRISLTQAKTLKNELVLYAETVTGGHYHEAMLCIYDEDRRKARQPCACNLVAVYNNFEQEAAMMEKEFGCITDPEEVKEWLHPGDLAFPVEYVTTFIPDKYD